ncbi:hypothetical protein PF005_g14453 [Phytophthora fragariae]|uniref:Uncharacterized protein n=1 Tax=Phytophthora fragariae TaxID=53985 RepID=A0A6A3RSE5_9STRA|nr:hypothetical protein PF003_g22830 [Phytophthora fragariae]KAE8934187.1 hypothetical protein PF009_g15827 [Phytophthora fragariae]KAE9002390.1 hypothetical protein PF011_g13335 [Phytophthora fragariae]KAE9102315.1 hypothetical protein PF007_g14804 [Phytophthora fragariae]KAE9138965.1 hypothetical protein PF006_g13846 [Phytophthora fragariae]
MRRENLPPEAAAVAAFLSDISGFLDEEDYSNSSSNAHQDTQLTTCVQNETLANNVTAPTVGQAQRPPPEDEPARKRALRNVQTGKRRDAYRQRLKEERRTLRCVEVELAARLEEMQQNRKNDSGRAAWRAIAMRQLEGRRVAEAQQERLQTAVKRRRELIQDVEDTLRKRLREVEETFSTERDTACLGATDEGLFEAYLSELDAIYTQTDDVFRSCEAEPTTGPFLNTKPLKKRDGDVEYFEKVGVLRVPFEFKRTCVALWAVTRQPYRQLDREEYSGVLDVENTIAMRFRVKCRLQTGGLVSLWTHFVSRYVEEGRTVIIWRELWEGEGEFEGIHSDETGWCTIQPRERATDAVVSPDDVPGNFSTIIQTCVRLVPMHFSTSISFDPDFDRFTEVLVTSGKEDNVQVEHMMERLQLRDALAEVRLESC